MNEREAVLEAELKAARAEIKLLREKVDALVRLIYGQSSEKVDTQQLMLLLESSESKKVEAPAAVEVEAGAVTRAKARRRPHAPRLPEHLPVEEEVIDPEVVQAEPEQWRLIGQEVSEQLDYQPGRFCKRRRIRRKYVRRDTPQSPPVIAPLPAGLQERCLGSADLIAHVVVSKYVDHLPLYRQEQIYRSRYGVHIPRQTLCRWVALAADWLKPVYERMKREQGHCAYLQVDETPIRYLVPGSGKAPQGYFWVSSAPGGDVIYHWHPGRGAACLDKVLDSQFSGTVQCDGYQAYPSWQKQRDGPVVDLAGCWAHVRRKFYQGRERDPRIAGWILRQIGQLYGIEKRLRVAKAGPALRGAIRSSQSAPVVARLKKALMRLRRRYLPQSTLAKAIDYALSQWTRLVVFLQNGAIEIDNNLVENAIRLWARRTGCSSVRRTAVQPAPSSTP